MGYNKLDSDTVVIKACTEEEALHKAMVKDPLFKKGHEIELQFKHSRKGNQVWKKVNGKKTQIN